MNKFIKLTENKEFLAELDALFEKYSAHATEDEISHEPKFKTGDFVVATNGDVTQIKEVLENENRYKTSENDYIPFLSEIHWHLWTIQDAKDGDVLYYKSSGIEYIMILKCISKSGTLDSYCRYNTIAGFAVDVPKVMSIHYDNPNPATKEQRDLLFSKMKEAGYEWNAEEKDLRKKFYPIFEVGDTIQSNSTFATITEIKDNEYYSERCRICSIYEQYDWNKVKRWRDNKDVRPKGFRLHASGYIEDSAEQRKGSPTFATEAQAKSALAMARISQIMANDERFGGVVTDDEWESGTEYYAIKANLRNEVIPVISIFYKEFLAFHTEKQRDLMLSENRDLIEQYLMIPKKGE